MAYQAGGQRSVPRPVPESLEAREAQAYLQDYAALLDSVPFPSVVLDHRWDVVLSNAAFRDTFQRRGPAPDGHAGRQLPPVRALPPGRRHGPRRPRVRAGACRCSPTSPPRWSTTARTGACSPSAGTSPRTRSWTPPTATACRTGSARSARAAVEHDGAVRPLRPPRPALGRHRLPDRRRDPQHPPRHGLHAHDAGPARGAPPGRRPAQDAPPPARRGEPSERGALPGEVSRYPPAPPAFRSPTAPELTARP